MHQIPSRMTHDQEHQRYAPEAPMQWFARPAEKHARSLLDLPVSRRCMQHFLRFRMGCHRLPRDVAA